MFSVSAKLKHWGNIEKHWTWCWMFYEKLLCNVFAENVVQSSGDRVIFRTYLEDSIWIYEGWWIVMTLIYCLVPCFTFLAIPSSSKKAILCRHILLWRKNWPEYDWEHLLSFLISLILQTSHRSVFCKVNCCQSK